MKPEDKFEKITIDLSPFGWVSPSALPLLPAPVLPILKA